MALTETIKTDYTDLESGATTLKETVTNVNDIINEANKAVNDLNNESTFYGPIADYCLGNWTTITKLSYEDTTTLNTASTTLTNISANYQSSDEESGESVGSV